MITGLTFFLVDYANWMLAITTPEKTDNEAWALIAWTVAYVLLFLIHAIPLMTVYIHFGQVILSGQILTLFDWSLYKESWIMILGDFLILLLRIIGSLVAIFYGVIKAFKHATRHSDQPLWERLLRSIYGLFMHSILYLFGLAITCVIPFAGGKKRTLFNSLLFCIQYTTVFLQLFFAEKNGTIKQATQQFYENNIGDKLPDLGKTFLKITEAITPQRFCIVFIVLSWFLFFVTVRWYLDEHRSRFLENATDYLNRNERGAPEYYENCEYFDRKKYEAMRYAAIDAVRMNPDYINRLDFFDPLNKIERRRCEERYELLMQERFEEHRQGLLADQRNEGSLSDGEHQFRTEFPEITVHSIDAGSVVSSERNLSEMPKITSNRSQNLTLGNSPSTRMRFSNRFDESRKNLYLLRNTGAKIKSMRDNELPPLGQSITKDGKSMTYI